MLFKVRLLVILMGLSLVARTSVSAETTAISTAYWDRLGNAEWGARYPGWGDSHWVDADERPLHAFPDDDQTHAMISANTVTVAEDRTARSLTVDGTGAAEIADGRTLSLAVGANVGTALGFGAGARLMIGEGGSIHDMTTAGDVTIGNGGTMIVSGFADQGIPGTLTKQGAGTLLLENSLGTDLSTAATTFNVEAGTLTFRGPNPLGGSANIRLAGGILRIEGEAHSSQHNALTHNGYLEVSDDANFDFEGNGGLLAVVPVGTGLLTDGPGGRGLDFADDDDWIGAGVGIDRVDHYQNVFTGTFHAPSLGEYEFRVARYDDRGTIWLDLDRDGVFSSPGNNGDERIVWQNSATRYLTLGAFSYDVAIGHAEYGLGSKLEVRVKTPAMAEQAAIKPTDSSQVGLWTTTQTVFSALEQAGTSLVVSEDSGLHAVTNVGADFGTLTMEQGVLTTRGGGDGIRFTDTTIPEDAAAVGFRVYAKTDLGVIDANSAEVTISKDGPAEMLLLLDEGDDVNDTLNRATFDVRQGRLTALDGAIAGAALQLGGGQLVLAARDDHTDVTFDNALAVYADSELTAGSGGVGGQGPLILILGSEEHGVELDAGRLTLRTTDQYNLYIPGGLGGDGRLELVAGNVAVAETFSPSSLSVSGTLTVPEITSGQVTIHVGGIVNTSGPIAVDDLDVSGTLVRRGVSAGSRDVTIGSGGRLVLREGAVLDMTGPTAGILTTAGADVVVNGGELIVENEWTAQELLVAGGLVDTAADVTVADLYLIDGSVNTNASQVIVSHRLKLRDTSYHLDGEHVLKVRGSNLIDRTEMTLGGGTLDVQPELIYQPGLEWGALDGRDNEVDYPETVVLTADLAETESTIPYYTTRVFTGSFFDADGIVSFRESIDDDFYLKIDGNVLIDDNAWNNISTVDLRLDPGWHVFEMRLSNGAGGSGPHTGYGFSFDPTGNGDYVHPMDTGDASMFAHLDGSGARQPILQENVDLVLTAPTTLHADVDQAALFGNLTLQSGAELTITGMPSVSVDHLMAAHGTGVEGDLVVRGGLSLDNGPAALWVIGDLEMAGGSLCSAGLGASVDQSVSATGNVVLGAGVTLVVEAIDRLETVGDTTRTVFAAAGTEGITGTFATVPDVGDFSLPTTHPDRFGTYLGKGVWFGNDKTGEGVLYVGAPAVVTAVDVAVFQAKPGDCNGDRSISFADFNDFANNYTGALASGTGGKEWRQGDFNADGDVDFGDFNDLANYYTGAGVEYGPAKAPGADPKPTPGGRGSLPAPEVARANKPPMSPDEQERTDNAALIVYLADFTDADDGQFHPAGEVVLCVDGGLKAPPMRLNGCEVYSESGSLVPDPGGVPYPFLGGAYAEESSTAIVVLSGLTSPLYVSGHKELTLGWGYDVETKGRQDLVFRYGTSEGVISGDVLYVVPEPGALLLLACGAAAALLWWGRRRRAARVVATVWEGP